MRRILVIEDNTELRRHVADYLSDVGYSVATAADGIEALEQMRRQRPDVLLLDLTMPVMDGWSFVETLRTQTHWSGIPIVLVSGIDDVGPIARRLGVYAFVRKPFDLQELADAIERLADGSTPQPPAAEAAPASA